MSEATFLHQVLFDGTGSGRALTNDELGAWTPEQGLLWLHFDVGNTAAAQWLHDEPDVADHVVELLLAGDTRPQTSVLENGILIVLRGVNVNPGADPDDMVSARVWIEKNRIITSRRRRIFSITDVRDALLSGEGPNDAGEFVVMLLSQLSARIGDFVDNIESRLETLDEGEYVDAAGARKVAELRRQIATVRRYIAPQRDAIERLYVQSTERFTAEDLEYIRLEADALTRHLEDLDLARDNAAFLQDEHRAHIAAEQNSRMYVLSVVAAIFLPLTFATGLFGMNLGGLPGLESPLGFTIATAVMGGLGVLLALYFRYRRWF